MDVVDFSELYRTYAVDVYQFALFLSGDAAVAEDIVSETFIRLWHEFVFNAIVRPRLR
jgi:DNA-directed RNA polymerase specialized sigma24 family protein